MNAATGEVGSMAAWALGVCESLGQPQAVLGLQHAELPPLGDDEILVDILAVGEHAVTRK